VATVKRKSLDSLDQSHPISRQPGITHPPTAGARWFKSFSTATARRLGCCEKLITAIKDVKNGGMAADTDQMEKVLTEQLEYCEKMLEMEARLDLVVAMLEEIINDLSTSKTWLTEEKRSKLLERAKISYYRAKTLLYLTETTRGTKF